MIDYHLSKALLEIISIFRAHVANCMLIENTSVRERNLVRLGVLERALIELSQLEDEPPSGEARPRAGS
jgi:hypothetical protein